MKFLHRFFVCSLSVWLGLAGVYGQASRIRVAEVDLDELVRLTKETPALAFPATSITELQWALRLETWVKKRFEAAVVAELTAAGLPEAATDAPKLINAWVNVGGSGRPSEWSDRLRQAVPVKAGAPLTQFFAGVMAMRSGERTESRARWRTCLKENAEGRGSSIFAALAASRLLENPSVQRNAADEDRCFELIDEVLENEKFPDDEMDFLVHFLNERIATEARRVLAPRLLELYKASKLPEWARQHLIGLAHSDLNYAKVDRAEKVAHLRDARKALVRSWELRPQRPESAAELISISHRERYFDGAVDEPRLWFDRAIAASFDFGNAYHYYIYSIEARFSGVNKEVFSLGVACAKTGRADTEVPEKFLSTLQEITAPLDTWRGLMARPEIAQLVLRVRRDGLDYALKQKAEGIIRLARAELGCAALLVGDAPTALEQFDLLKDASGEPAVPPSAILRISSWNVDWANALHECRLLAGPAKEAWQKAAKARAAEDFPAAITAAEEAIQQQPAEKAWLESWKALVTFERDFPTSTGWVPLPKGAAAWHTSFGEWKWRADGTLAGRMLTSDPRTSADFRGRLGPRFELRGKFQIEGKKSNHYAFGFVMGSDPSRTNEAQSLLLVQFFGSDSGAAASMSGYTPNPSRNYGQKELGVVTLAETNAFRFVRDGERFDGWLNDGHFAENVEVSRSLRSGADAAGFLIYQPNASEPFLITDLEVRRLEDQK